ncbi:MAG: hypothetical protein ACAH21_11875 [Ramlibacter sp.]|nr:hypothetical protein [Ramlibacter sp.]
MCNALPDHEAIALSPEAHRHAYNAAFDELGLTWHWDAATFARLHAGHTGRASVQAYLEADHPHLLRAYDAEFLVNAIETTKGRCLAGIARLQRGPASHTAWSPDSMRLAA